MMTATALAGSAFAQSPEMEVATRKEWLDDGSVILF